ncbi:MAG TPA: hypothetical protein VF272_03965 [Candidatus Saccharimonadia bacterium]
MIKTQSGGASIIAVGFIAILILILTVSITRLMVGELRHALDMENNMNAYYQAEGGVEEAILALRHLSSVDPDALLTTPNQNCDVDGVPTNFGVAGGTSIAANANITCRRIRTVSNFVDSTLLIGESAHFDVSRKNFHAIEIEWDSESLNKQSPDTDFSNLQQGHPAPPFLEVTRIEYPNTGAVTNINPTAISIKSLFLAPTKGVPDCFAGTGTTNYQDCEGDDGTLAPGGRVKTKCSIKPIYRCKVVFTHFMASTPPATRTVLRLRPYFGAMQYTMKLYDSTGKRVDIGLDKTIIDVTARIGGSYRRIEQEVTLLPKPLEGIEAVFGDDKVCKKFEIINTGSGEFLREDSIPPDCLLD